MQNSLNFLFLVSSSLIHFIFYYFLFINSHFYSPIHLLLFSNYPNPSLSNSLSISYNTPYYSNSLSLIPYSSLIIPHIPIISHLISHSPSLIYLTHSITHSPFIYLPFIITLSTTSISHYYLYHITTTIIIVFSIIISHHHSLLIIVNIIIISNSLITFFLIILSNTIILFPHHLLSSYNPFIFVSQYYYIISLYSHIHSTSYSISHSLITINAIYSQNPHIITSLDTPLNTSVDSYLEKNYLLMF